MYDFILFENFHQATNHYKDICIIAQYLSSAGYAVAIADVFQEDKYCLVEGVPHISLGVKRDIDLAVSGNKNKTLAFIHNALTQVRVSKYLYKVVKELHSQASFFYVGSYHCGMSLKWIKLLARDKVVFFWGLRSSRLMEFKFRPLSPVGINGFILWSYLKNNDNLKFFVSDELIKQEFIHTGISEARLIIRPERYIRALPKEKRSLNGTLKLLSAGTLRKAKRIELCLEALAKIGDSSISYTIAGRADSQYEGTIQSAITTQNVKRLNYRLSDDEYEQLFLSNDFLFLGDMKQPSLVTNGTMNEALLRGMPIIAPDYDPYRYYVALFGVGILYKPDDLESIIIAIKRAKEERCEVYQERIRNYARQYLYDNIVMELKKNLAVTLNK